jgi:hypothetical protein
MLFDTFWNEGYQWTMYSCWSWSDHWLMYIVLQLNVYCNMRIELNIVSVTWVQVSWLRMQYLYTPCRPFVCYENCCFQGCDILLCTSQRTVIFMATPMRTSNFTLFLMIPSCYVGHFQTIKDGIEDYNKVTLNIPLQWHRQWEDESIESPQTPFWAAKVTKVYILSSWK